MIINFNIGFQILALIILLLLHVMFNIYRKIFLIREKVFFLILNFATVETLLDILHIVAINFRGYLSDTMVLLIARFYLLSIVIFASCILLYALTEIYLGDLFADKRRYMFIGLDAVAFPIILNLDLDFYIDEVKIGISGPAIYATCLISLIYLCLAIYYTFRMSDRVNKIRRITVAISCMILVTTAIVQINSKKNLVLSAAISFVMIYMYFCLEPPGEYVDGTLGVFNNEAYQLYIRNRMTNKKSVSLLYIRIAEYNKMSEVFGNRLRTIFLKKLCDYLSEFNSAKTFYIGNGELILSFEQSDYFIKYFQQIRKRLTEVWNVSESDGEVVELEVNSIVIAYPSERMEDDLSVDNVVSTLDYFISKFRTNTKNTFLCIDRKELREKQQYDNVVANLKEAIKENRIDVHYQCIYSVEEDRTVGLEALMRITDDRGQYLNNDMVIDYAEKNGYIRELGNIVLKKICSFVRTHSLYELEIYTINVNLSVVQCQDSRMAADFIEIMERYELPASMFRFEISNSLTTYATINFKKNIERLLEIGAEFIVDNYGQSNTSIENMLQMNINSVKLSPKTVKDFFANARVRNSIRIDCQLLRQMNVAVMAVGVENQQQINEFKKMGITLMQGNAFYKPMEGLMLLKALSRERDNGLEREALYERIL